MKKVIKIVLCIFFCLSGALQAATPGLWLAQLALSGGKNIAGGLLNYPIFKYCVESQCSDVPPSVTGRVQEIAKQMGLENVQHIKVKKDPFLRRNMGATWDSTIAMDPYFSRVLAGECDTITIEDDLGSIVLSPQDSIDVLEGYCGHELAHNFNNDIQKMSSAYVSVPLATWGTGYVMHNKVNPLIHSRLRIPSGSLASKRIGLAGIAVLGLVQSPLNDLILQGYSRYQERQADALTPNQRGLGINLYVESILQSDKSREWHNSWFCTHPSPESRAQLAFERAKLLGQPEFDKGSLVVRSRFEEARKRYEQLLSSPFE